jgi:hypothetical protein
VPTYFRWENVHEKAGAHDCHPLEVGVWEACAEDGLVNDIIRKEVADKIVQFFKR